MVKNKNFLLVKKVVLIVEPLILGLCIIGGFVAKPAVTFVFGYEYAMAAKVLYMLLPIILATLPGCLLGFPTLSALGLYREVNISNFIAAVFHMIGLTVLYFRESITIFTVAILTCCTEWLLVIIRGVFVNKVTRIKEKKGLYHKSDFGEE